MNEFVYYSFYLDGKWITVVKDLWKKEICRAEGDTIESSLHNALLKEKELFPDNFKTEQVQDFFSKYRIS